MSINFEKPLTDEKQNFLRNFMGDDLAALDTKTALLNSRNIDGRKMKCIANGLNQAVTVEINEPDEVKTMTDGTRYRCTRKGWVKI